MSEGAGDNFSELLANLCYTALIIVEIWVVVDHQLDGQLSEKAKDWWKKLHRESHREQEIQRQASHVIFEAIQIVEGSRES